MEIIDTILNEYRSQLKNDFQAYRNHAVRIYSYCTAIDRNCHELEKYAIASAFHDLGIWVNDTFDYIDPSIALAENYLKMEGKESLIAEVCLLINWHHKIKPYHGSFSDSVEVFRKSDLIDLTSGFIQFGITKRYIREQIRNVPVLGFRKLLLKVFLKNLRKMPLRHLPMLKW